jgi:hypothetical protein
MTENINDPCEKQEVVENTPVDGPSAPPVQPRSIVQPESLFPTRQRQPLEQSTVRESALINEEHFSEEFEMNKLRLPEAADPGDTFRLAAGFVYQFVSQDLSYFNTSLERNSELGVPFSTDISQAEVLRTRPNQRPRTSYQLSLEFDKIFFGFLLANSVQNFPDEQINTIMYNYVKGQGTFTSPLLPPPGRTFIDTTTISPSAFFRSESDQSSVPLVDVASFEPVVGNLPLRENSAAEISRTSLYRLYSSIRRDGIPTTVENDSVQKFDSSAIRQLGDINEQATNQGLRAQLSIDAENALNTHMKIEFTMNSHSEFSEILRLNGLDSVFMDFLGSSGEESLREHVQVLDQSVLGGSSNNRLIFDYKPRVYDADAFLTSINQNIFQTIQFMSSVEKDHPIPYYTNGAEDIRPLLDHSYFTGTPERSVNQLVYNKKRSLRDLLTGEKCYSEIVAYRVEKTRVSDGEVVQDFYFLNDQHTTSLRFLDTQVSYNQLYEYKIYAINLVIGDSTSYEEVGEVSPETFVVARPRVNFNMLNETVLHLIETPYFSQQVLMIDKPPMFPQVEVIPFFQNSEKVGFRMTPTFGAITERPIQILEEDRQKQENMLLNTGPYSETVEYSSDSQPTKYELLILEEVPYSYQDFSEAQRIVVSATHNSGYIEANLTPNRRYYLTFRASDVSGVSNPSAVYTIVMNSHADGVFVEFDEFDLMPEKSEEPITFERFLKIDPSQEQTSVDFTDHQDQDAFYLEAPSVKELSLGNAEHKVWAKDFKFRLLSRTTGKAIDINVGYNFKIIIPPEKLRLYRPGSADTVNAGTLRVPSGTGMRNPFQVDRNPLTEYDEQGRPVRSNVQADPTNNFPGIGDY